MKKMILKESQLFEAVFAKFDIEISETCDFSASFEGATCDTDCGPFVKDVAYNLWLGNLKVKGIKTYFACQIDGEVEKVSEDTFDINDRPLTFMNSDGLFAVIYNSHGIHEVIPSWRLDLLKVKNKGRFNKKYKKITGKFEYIGNGDKTFFAWVFYSEGKVLKVFNIESGEWSEPEDAIMRLSLVGKQILKDIEFSQELDFIEITAVPKPLD